jgi:hypothetical protein
LWQSRYKAKLIDAQDYLTRVITYIHLNPVRAGLAGKPVKYTLAGRRELMGKIKSPLCDADESLLAFGPTVKTARRAYVGVLKQAMMEDGLSDEVDRLPWWNRDRELDVNPDRAYVDVLGRTTGLERQNLRPEQFIALACECLGADYRDVAGRRQDSETGRLRRLIAFSRIERWDQRAGELAAVLRKHPVVVSRWFSEASRIRSENHAFADELDALDDALAKKAIERLADFGASKQESQESFSWQWLGSRGSLSWHWLWLTRGRGERDGRRGRRPHNIASLAWPAGAGGRTNQPGPFLALAPRPVSGSLVVGWQGVPGPSPGIGDARFNPRSLLPSELW